MKQVTPALEIVILKALEKEPRERYQSAVELYVALEDQKNRPLILHDSDRHTRLTPHPKLGCYATIKALPSAYVHRPDLLEPLRDLVLGTSGPVAVTALEGMGGIGKTELARALCHDPQVRATFRDGIVWIQVGKECGSSIRDRMAHVADVLNEDSSAYTSLLSQIILYNAGPCRG